MWTSGISMCGSSMCGSSTCGNSTGAALYTGNGTCWAAAAALTAVCADAAAAAFWADAATAAGCCADATPATVIRTIEARTVSFVVMVSANRRSGRPCARGIWLFKAMLQLVGHHPHFEEQSRRVDAAANLVEVGRRGLRRLVHDVEQHALDFFEHGSQRRLVHGNGVLTIKPACRHEVGCP